MTERRPTYERLATLTIVSSERPGERVAAEIIEALGLAEEVPDLVDPKRADSTAGTDSTESTKESTT
jgi:hypothetical protein